MSDDQLQIPVEPDQPEPAESDEAAVEPPELPEGWLSEFGF